MAGYGVFIATGKEFFNAFPDRTFQSPLIELLLKSGRNGNIKLPTPCTKINIAYDFLVFNFHFIAF